MIRLGPDGMDGVLGEVTFFLVSSRGGTVNPWAERMARWLTSSRRRGSIFGITVIEDEDVTWSAVKLASTEPAALARPPDSQE